MERLYISTFCVTMEIGVREDVHFGFVVSSWLYGQRVGPRFELNDIDGTVEFSWRCPNEECPLESITIHTKESIAGVTAILDRHLPNAMGVFPKGHLPEGGSLERGHLPKEGGEIYPLLLPLAEEAFVVASCQGYFDDLGEDFVNELTRSLSYDRGWFTCYGFLALNLPLRIMEALVPPIKICPDLPVLRGP
jgi:hypothetical protein